MILFRKDYANFPNAIVDYKTKNTSFLELARLLHSMGIKNSVFHLTLLQPELQGVDPHDPNLTLDQKTMIGVECRYNIWYYLRECVRIPPVASSESIPFRANRGNISLVWCFMNHIDYALIQPRQTGKSVSTDCLMLWLIFIGASNTLINMITKDNDLRVQNVERIKKIRDLLPGYLVTRHKRDSDNQHEVTCKALDNKYKTGVAQPNEASANKLGRGLTSPITHIDEPPFITHIGTTLPAALASGNAARDEAARHGRPYGNIFTTTAGKKDDRDGKYMYDMIHGGAIWDEVYYDCHDIDDLVDKISKNMTGKKIIINGTFSHRQLGYTDEWLYRKMAESNSMGDAANRDFFNVWTSGAQGSPLSPALNEKIRKAVKEIIHRTMTKEGFIIRWYVDEEELKHRLKTSKIILGLDTSDAIGRDGIGAVFTDAYDLKVIGAFNTNETNLILFSSFIATLMIENPNIIFIPERKSSAQTIIDLLLLRLPAEKIDPFKRIYNVIVDDKLSRAEDFKLIQQDMSRRNAAFYDRYKSCFGFVTTSASRDTLYQQVLQNAAKVAGHLVHDKALSAEIRGLVVRNGRIDHKLGGNDDLVIAWMLTHWMLTHSKNLSYYGIDTARMEISHSENTEEEVSEVQKYEREVQRKLNDEVNQLIKEIEECENEFEVMRLEHRLKVAYMKLRPSDKDAISIDSVIREAAEKRKYKVRTNKQVIQNFDINSMWRNSGRGQLQRKVNSQY